MLEGQYGSSGQAGAEHGGDKERQAEVRALLDARDALEELEAQLELYQVRPQATWDSHGVPLPWQSKAGEQRTASLAEQGRGGGALRR